MSIRFEDKENNQVLRLFSTEEAAIAAAGRRPLMPILHESETGWLLLDPASGQRYDDDGLIPNVTQ